MMPADEVDCPLVLRAGGVPVAEYVWRPELPRTASPRPYLHPVRTLAGTPVTEFQPADHPHHLGASLAVSDLGGANFWGGRTYVSGQGPTWLDNHGEQRHTGFLRADAAGFVEVLDWRGPDGKALAREQRTVHIGPIAGAGEGVGRGPRGGAGGGAPDSPRGWVLDVTFEVTNLTGQTLTIESSATKGRAGAGYGGFFWRAPKTAEPARVFTRDADGEPAVHGSTAAWLALAGYAPDGNAWTLVFRQPGPSTVDPWFVRVGEYPGVGPALAWNRPLAVGDTVSETLTRRVVTVILDGHPDREELTEILP